jgi:hypothetical protein
MEALLPFLVPLFPTKVGNVQVFKVVKRLLQVEKL